MKVIFLSIFENGYDVMHWKGLLYMVTEAQAVHTSWDGLCSLWLML